MFLVRHRRLIVCDSFKTRLLAVDEFVRWPWSELVMLVDDDEVEGREERSMLDDEQIEDEPVRSVRPLELLLLELVSEIELCVGGGVDSPLMVSVCCGWACVGLLSVGWERFRDECVDEIDRASLFSETDSTLEVFLLTFFRTFYL